MEGDSLPQNGLLVVTAFWVGGTMSGGHDLPDALADLRPGAQGVHSLLEYRYVSRVERPHGLPPGRRQRAVTRAGRCQFQDVAYEEYGVLAELDGQAAHPVGGGGATLPGTTRTPLPGRSRSAMAGPT